MIEIKANDIDEGGDEVAEDDNLDWNPNLKVEIENDGAPGGNGCYPGAIW